MFGLDGKADDRKEWGYIYGASQGVHRKCYYHSVIGFQDEKYLFLSKALCVRDNVVIFDRLGSIWFSFAVLVSVFSY